MILPIITPEQLATMSEAERDLNWKLSAINELLVSSLYTGHCKIEMTAEKSLSDALCPLLAQAGYTVQKDSMLHTDFITVTLTKP